MDLDEDLGLPDQIVATLRGHTILKKWRQKVDEMSVEGNEWVDMAKSYLPLTFADEDGDKIAMRLVHFIQVGQQELKAAPPKTKEEKRCEAAIDILRATCETSAVKIQYVPDKIHGTAVKLKDAMWMVFLRDDRNFTVNKLIYWTQPNTKLSKRLRICRSKPNANTNKNKIDNGRETN